jgi:hypothetical protein
MDQSHTSLDPPKKGRLARVARSFKERLRGWLGAEPLPTPTRNLQSQEFAGMERAFEVVRYATLRFEHWVSPNGFLRAFLRLCIQIALFVGIPAVILGPALVLFLEQAVAVATQLAALAHQLVQLSFSLITATVGFVLLGAMWRALSRRK